MAKTKATQNGVTPSDILTLAEAATYLKVSETGLQAEAELGRIPARLIAGQWRFSKASILTWFNQHNSPKPPRTHADQMLALEHFWATRSIPPETDEEVEAFIKKIYDARKEQPVT